MTCDKDDQSDEEQRQVKNPVLLIEIFSQSTGETDVEDKVKEYHDIPSVKEYLVVDSRRRWARLHRRNVIGAFEITDYIGGQIT